MWLDFRRMPHKPPRPHHVPSSAIASFIDRDRIEALLAPFVPDEEDRRFVLRCLLDEGPAHHRGANYVLLALLGEVAGEIAPRPSSASDIPVPMRLPPHLAKDRAGDDDGDFPLHMPKAPLSRLAKEGTPAFDAMVDCLTDGPPQHSLANAAMVCVLSALLERSRK